MELLYVDRTEGFDADLNLKNRPDLSEAIGIADLNLAGGDTSGNVGGIASRLQVNEGVLSPKALAFRGGAGSGRYGWVQMVGRTHEQGAAAIGFAYHNDGNEEELTQIAQVEVNEAWEGVIYNATTKEITFMGESGAVSDISLMAPNYFEISVDVDSGDFSVHVNDIGIISGNKEIAKVNSAVRLWAGPPTGRPANSSLYYFDDIYILGGDTGSYSSRLGPVRAVRAPLATATRTDFTPVGAETNIEAVNKTDLDTNSYNRSPAADDTRDMYKLDLSSVPDDKPIIAVSHQLYHKKTDVGPRRLQAVAKLDSAEQAELLGDRIAAFGASEPMVLPEKPGGGSWTYEDLEDAEFGYEVIEHE